MYRPGGSRLNVMDKIPLLLKKDNITGSVSWGSKLASEGEYVWGVKVWRNFREKPIIKDVKEEENGGYLRDEEESEFTLNINPTAEYLKCLNYHIMDYIIENEAKETINDKKKSKLRKRFKFKYIMTVPATWNESARNKFVQEAIEAKIISKNKIHRLTLIDEPDAAMVFSKSLLFGRFGSFKNEGRKIILCDAGGLNVHVFTYYWGFQEGKAKFHQILEGNSDTCGSKNLNIRFTNHLIKEVFHKLGINFEMFPGITTYFENVYKVI